MADRNVTPARFALTPGLVILVIGLVLVGGLLLSSFYVVDQTEQAVITTFGRDLATAMTEFARPTVSGRQSQTWVRTAAPGHGGEDFVTGQKYGLDAYAPVDADGRFTADVERWAGMSVWKANDPIVALLHETGRLANKPGEKIAHSYPHCWRSKGPVIFRATEQWFVALKRAFAGRILGVSEEVAEAWGAMSATRTYPLFDGLLAATAMVHGLILVTRNGNDIGGSGARFVDPFQDRRVRIAR